MIDIQKEKKSALSASDIHEICDMAMQAAEMNGFISSFDFERAIWSFAAIVLYPDLQEEVNPKIAEEGALAVYNELLQNGTIEKILKEYPIESELLGDIATSWYEDYVKYATSIRGTLNAFQTYSGDLLQKGAEQLYRAQSNPDFKNAYKIADKWGMNNDSPQDAGKPLFYEE